ncbi:hypothetical protein J6590_094826 [Homalodisca vitripennis]|nr:hypothetical protein J6590_094826 [Homalodisca vitripennis]
MLTTADLSVSYGSAQECSQCRNRGKETSTSNNMERPISKSNHTSRVQLNINLSEEIIKTNDWKQFKSQLLHFRESKAVEDIIIRAIARTRETTRICVKYAFHIGPAPSTVVFGNYGDRELNKGQETCTKLIGEHFSYRTKLMVPHKLLRIILGCSRRTSYRKQVRFCRNESGVRLIELVYNQFLFGCLRLDYWNLESCLSEEIQRKSTTKKLKTKHLHRFDSRDTYKKVNLVVSLSHQTRSLREHDSRFQEGSPRQHQIPDAARKGSLGNPYGCPGADFTNRKCRYIGLEGLPLKTVASLDMCVVALTALTGGGDMTDTVPAILPHGSQQEAGGNLYLNLTHLEYPYTTEASVREQNLKHKDESF